MSNFTDNTVKRIVLSTPSVCASTSASTSASSIALMDPDLSHLSREQLYAYRKFTQGCNLFITGQNEKSWPLSMTGIPDSFNNCTFNFCKSIFPV